MVVCVQVVVPPGLTDTVLSEVLAPVSAAKWLHFTDITSVFAGFTDSAHKLEYEAWLDKVVLPWCCKPAGDDGGSLASSSRREEGVEGLELSGGVEVVPLQGITELPTSAPGWAMVEVKARQAGADKAV